LKPVKWHEYFYRNISNVFGNDWQTQQTPTADEYALTKPPEFFAVCSENFFESPTNE